MTNFAFLRSTVDSAVGQDDAFTIEASHMALSNNALIRGFNSIYQQAPHLSLDADKSDFVGYCISWAECVLTHYEYETCNLFLGIEKAARERGLMNSHSSLEGHLFYVELDSIRRYLLYIRFRGFGFSSTELLRLMDRFKKMFHEHLKSKPLALAAIVEYSTPGNPIDIHRIVETAGKSVRFVMLATSLSSSNDTISVWRQKENNLKKSTGNTSSTLCPSSS